tara:strand:- start:1959 stop:2891 length:933 start_codon:yes stop_codon:yes gene_type:complete
MKTKMIPLLEKIKVLTFLQSKVPQGGSFTFTYLKSQNQYQITLVNRKAHSSDIKHRDTNIEDCFQYAISQLEFEYKAENKYEFWGEYEKEGENEMLKHQLNQSNSLLSSLQVKYDNLIRKTRENRGDFMPFIDSGQDFDEPKIAMPQPIDEFLKNLPEEVVSNPVKKRKVRPQGVFTSEQIDKEIFRKLKGKFVSIERTTPGNSPKSAPLKTMGDLREWANICRIGYLKQRKKANKRLLNKRSLKNVEKVKNLDVKPNKYDIRKSDIIDEMKRVLKGEFDKLNTKNHLTEWMKAKNRVWNRYSTGRNDKK